MREIGYDKYTEYIVDSHIYYLYVHILHFLS